MLNLVVRKVTARLWKVKILSTRSLVRSLLLVQKHSKKLFASTQIQQVPVFLTAHPSACCLQHSERCTLGKRKQMDGFVDDTTGLEGRTPCRHVMTSLGWNQQVFPVCLRLQGWSRGCGDPTLHDCNRRWPIANVCEERDTLATLKQSSNAVFCTVSSPFVTVTNTPTVLYTVSGVNSLRSYCPARREHVGREGLAPRMLNPGNR
jgi:hypothetical protein